MFATLIYSGCKKVEPVKQTNSIQKLKEEKTLKQTEIQNQLVSKPNTQKKNVISENIIEEISENSLDFSNPFIKRVLGFEKLELNDRIKIAKNIIFDKNVPCGISNQADILNKLNNEDLLSFYETFLNSKSVAILSASELDTIIIASKIDNNKHNNDTRKINPINSNWEEVYCWVSKQKHKYNPGLDVHPKCDIDNNSHCLYWNWQKNGCY